MHYRAKFHQNRSRLQRYGDLTFFQNGGRPQSWNCWGAYWDHPRRPLDGLYRCVKFGWNRCSSFDDVILLILYPFGLKTLIHAPKIAVFGGLISPPNGEQCQQITQKHILARVRVVWAIQRENLSTGLTCKWVHEKSIKKFRYISPICPEAPIVVFAPNLAHPYEPPT